MNEWKEVRLKDIVSILGDGLHGTPEYTEDGEYYFINGNNLNEGNIVINNDTKRVSYKEYLRYKKETNDRTLLVSINGTLGNVAYYQGEKVVLGKSACYFNLLDDIDKRFVKYIISSNYFTKYIHSYATGTTIKNVSLKTMREFSFNLPPLQEQKRIADVLSCLDAKIENLRRQNETLEAIAQTLFKHWFIDFEFPNADGKPYKSSGGAMVRSELGEIPESWRVGKLGDEFEIIMGQSPAGSSFNEDKQGMVFFQGRTDFGFRFPTVRLYTTEPTRIAEKFDVLVSVRAPVGDINVACEKCCIGRGLAAIKSKYKSYCLHKLKSYRKFFNVFESEGTVFGSINKQSFNNLASVIPPDKVIKEFESLVKTIDKKFYLNDLQIQTLTKTRDALLPKLMSGQLRVKE